LAYLLNLAGLDLDHLVLHFNLLLVVWSVDGSLSSFLPGDVAVLGQGHFLLAFNHLVVFIEGNELTVVALAVLHYFHAAKGA
jgi:hypothetical protein